MSGDLTPLDFFTSALGHSLGLVGLAAFVQTSVLGGVLLLGLMHWWERPRTTPLLGISVPLVFALSLMVNFQLMFAASLLGLGGRGFLLAAALVGAGLCVWLWRRRSVAEGLNTACREGSTPELGAAPAGSRAGARLTLCAALAGLLVLMAPITSHVPSVFEGWDVLASWNRWALEWAAQERAVAVTYGYPQLLPLWWASWYRWFASSEIEPLLRLLMALFPVLHALLFVDAWRRLREPAAALALLLWSLALAGLFPGQADSGYADAPVAFLLTLTLYLLLLGARAHLPLADAQRLAALCAGTALLMKQTGGLALLVLLGTVLFFNPHTPSWRARLAQAARCAALVLAVAGPWYLHQALQFWRGEDFSNIGYLTVGVHGGATWGERMTLAWSQVLRPALDHTGAPLLVMGVAGIGAALGLLEPLARRVLLALVLPYALLWALLFSYDLRNLMLVVAPASYGVAAGLLLGLRRVSWALRLRLEPAVKESLSAGVPRPARWGAASLVVVGVITLALVPVDTEQLFQLDRRLRLAQGDPELNAVLLREARGGAYEGRVLTSYGPMLSITELRAHAFVDPALRFRVDDMIKALRQGQNWCRIAPMIPGGHRISHVLLHEPFFPVFVNRSVDAGDFRVIYRANGLIYAAVDCASVPPNASSVPPVSR